MDIPKQPTVPELPLKREEKVFKDTIFPIKDCKYLLPCGKCDKTDQICSQYMTIEMKVK